MPHSVHALRQPGSHVRHSVCSLAPHLEYQLYHKFVKGIPAEKLESQFLRNRKHLGSAV